MLFYICPSSSSRALLNKDDGHTIRGQELLPKKEEYCEMFEDKTLVCQECHEEFVFTAGEQEFYASRGFENEPKRCPKCRAARKQATRATKEMFDAVCDECGKPCKVPFKPNGEKPVYCSECFAKRNAR